MSIAAIQIDLCTSGAVGSVATVKRKRMFRKPSTEVYVCSRAAWLLSAEWTNMITGLPADGALVLQLNEAAQAAARLAGRATGGDTR